MEDLNIATFELHNDLRVTKVLDAAGKPLTAERVTQDSTVRVQLPTPLAKDASTTLTFDYEGELIPPMTVPCRASSWPRSTTTPVTCFTPAAGFR